MPIPFTNSCEEIEQELIALGISTEHPDFYNNPEWIDYVGEVPDILHNYARFIDCRRYTDDYLRYAERSIRIVAESLYSELRQDGRQGACIDASGVLSQILEKEGVWAYQASGSITTAFPVGSNIPKLYNYSRDVTDLDFRTGHSWIVAPPYAIVDVTISQQEKRANIVEHGEYLPELILQKETSLANFDVTDICSPEYIVAAAAHGVSIQMFRADLRNNLGAFHSIFPAKSLITDRGVEIKYIPLGINSMDGPLEENRSLCLNGNYGTAIYEGLIKPRLVAEGLT